ncbi:uncharacterized protein LOC129762159 [Toxorhynchites rutilus septentrionalis]|uniref:uncharacterized protein LOC129762159 n=1 Tax=Toxorhynchites rutilus septentrionalis TaxID=329112 RepID=UPI00247964A1|nr:uncharacterized protein LOC129762159 [Toxorhynchites rutilus septentrionalis]XP_055616140.1 uncharacterized protein LOC129762159 [Toxorhynchites rutilus septentrionalis]
MLSRHSRDPTHQPVVVATAATPVVGNNHRNNSNNEITLSSPPMTTSLLVSTEKIIKVGEVHPAALEKQRNKRSAEGAANDDDDGEGKWPGLSIVRSGATSGGLSSSALLLGGIDRTTTGKLWCDNIYENVINGTSVVGVFGEYGKLRKCQENIYENICEDCGRLYSAEKCAFCSVEDEDVDTERTKKVNKYSVKFQEFLENFRIKPVKFGGGGVGGSTIQAKRKLCKSDIVHNVDGFEEVFRTNKSFDLGEICRMRDDNRSQVTVVGVAENLRSSRDDRGLHKSDDQLASSLASARQQPLDPGGTLKPPETACPPAAATEPEKAAPWKVSGRSLSENLIDFSEPSESETIYENLCPGRVRSGRCWLTAPPVDAWMTSLLVETEDYDAGAEVAYHVKHIPSVTFDDIGDSWGGCGSSSSRARLNCVVQGYSSDKVEEFRQNVLNERKRQREAEREEEDRSDSLDPVIITFRSSIFETESDVQLLASGERNRETEAPRQNNADRDGHVNDAISPYRVQVAREGEGDRLSQCKQCRSLAAKKRSLLREHLLRVSLCRVVITYERGLKAFLLIGAAAAAACELVRNRKLVLNKRKTYRKIMTNEAHNGSVSALLESVQIDKYFQFLEGNETMINLAAAKRRHRRRHNASELISAEVQSNSSNEISISSSNTSGIYSDCGASLDENIYQPIWTCKTDGGSEPTYESPQEHIYEYIRVDPARDESEWEVVDEFAFSKNRHHSLSQRSPPPVPNRNIRHPLDRYRNVCILYSPTAPKINRIVYDYRRDYVFDYRKTSEDVSPSDDVDEGDEDDGEDHGEENDSVLCDSCPGSESNEEDGDEGEDVAATLREIPARKHSCYSIPDCVQYWKFMLLNVNYNEDEEDVIMTEKTIAVIARNVEPNTQISSDHRVSLKNTTHTPSGLAAPNLPHSPKFSGPAVKSKSQIPATDGCVGTYTSKSADNLHEDTPASAKEKLPSPKRERLRDKMKAVLPLSSSRSADDGLVFGVELDQVERDEKLQIPRFVSECLEILKEPDFIETGGLYRASGNKNSIENIKKKLNEKRSPKKYEFLKKQDVHSLTGSLKLFFREMKSPLIPRDVYELCVQKTKDEAETIDNIRLGIDKMELINRNTLRYLIRHLKCVHQNSHVNMMNSSNLAIVWGACLFASTPGLMESYESNDLGRINTLVRQLIDYYDKIFYSDRAD